MVTRAFVKTGSGRKQQTRQLLELPGNERSAPGMICLFVRSFVWRLQAAVIELIVHKRRKKSERKRQQEAVRCFCLVYLISETLLDRDDGG